MSRLDPQLSVVVEQAQHSVLRLPRRIEAAQHGGRPGLWLEVADRPVDDQTQRDVDPEHDGDKSNDHHGRPPLGILVPQVPAAYGVPLDPGSPGT